MDAAMKAVGEYAVAKLDVRDGETLVIKVDALISMEVDRRIRQSIAHHLPEGVKVLVIGRDVDLQVIRAVDGEPARDA